MKKIIIILAVVVNFTACGGSTVSSSSASSETTSEAENTVAAVSSMFSGASGLEVETQSLTSRFTINSTGADICDPDNMANGPTGVFMSARGGVSTYPFGSVTDPMTISSLDYYCEDESNNPNTGTGPDGQGLFATFVFVGEPQGDCDDGSSFTFTKGSGIARNTQEYYPEIFGRFEISGGDMMNCTLRIREDGTVDLDHSSCTDDSSTPVSLDTTVSCTIDADIAEIEDPEYYKGHYGLGEDVDSNLNYACVNYDGFEQDDDHVMRVVNDCSALIDLGVNIEFLSIGAYATDTSEADDFSSWEIALSGTSHEELRTSIQLLHAAGLQVALAVDILYFADPEVPTDDVDFPAALINNTDFQDDLTDFIYEQVEFAENMDADIFIPLSESDRVFNLATVDDDEFLAGIMDEVDAGFSGKLAYVWSLDISEYNPENMAFFDLIGFNRSPQGRDHLDVNCVGSGVDSNCLAVVIEANLAAQEAIVNEVNSNYDGHAQHFIDSLGVWGSATETEPNLELEGSVDWMEDASVAALFTAVFTLADTYHAVGLVAWEGPSNEFVFPGQTLTLDAITQGFAGR